MADISKFSRLLNGIQRNVDMSTNSGLFQSLKLTDDGGSTSSELTKTILDNLIGLQDGSDVSASLHHHDGRYFTETELGSSGASSGSDLVGDDNTYSNFTPAAATVKGALSGIDTALASAGGTDFSDSLFRISDDGDSSKKIAFQASGITTSTLRTITMPDTDVNLGDIATNTAHSSGDGSDHQDVADLATLSGVAANSTNLGTFTGTTIPDSQTIKQALQALETYGENSRSLIQNFEWQNSALDYITDNTAVPPSEVSGDRYILSHDGGAPHANWDGASAGDIVEFNGSTWDAVTPTLGTFASADDEPNVLYYWGGSSWATKAFEATTASTGLTKTGFDIQLADAAAANGIAVSSGAISISLATDPGLEFSSGSLRVLVDPSGALERVTAGLDVKDLGIDTARLAATSVTAAKLGSDVAGDGLKGGNGAAIDIEPADFAGAGLEDDGSDDLRIASSAYDGTSISGGGGSAASVNYAPKIEEIMVAGESFAANSSFWVRMALNGETAGRVYKADKGAGAEGAETNTIYVIGLAQNRTGSAITAGSNIPVVKWGAATLQSADGTYTASQDEGLPVYLGASGAHTLTAPSSANDAIVKCGSVRNVGGSSAIEVGNFQIMGIVEA